MDFPPTSPDLNIIENVWSLLSRLVFADGKPKTDMESLKKDILEAWNAIPTETINSEVKSMYKRLRAVVDAHGLSTKY